MPPAETAASGRPAKKGNGDRASIWVEGLMWHKHGRAASSEERPFVVCRDVCKSYGAREVLRGIDLTVKRGEVVTSHGAERLGQKHALASY